MCKKLSSFDEIIDKYDGFFFDAFGVLVDGDGPLKGAKKALEKLKEKNKPYWIVSNGASKSSARALARYRELGFTLKDDGVITSGSLLTDYYKKNELQGKKTAVLGTESSLEYIREAGGELCGIEDDFEILVIANQTDYPFVESVDKAMSHIMNSYDKGKVVRLVLPNPDLFYPKSDGEYGFTAGSIASLMENIFTARFGEGHSLKFDKLENHIHRFSRKLAKEQTRKNVVMIGDQIVTDIKGAKDFGIDSVLMMTGLCSREAFEKEEHSKPTYVLDSF